MAQAWLLATMLLSGSLVTHAPADEGQFPGCVATSDSALCTWTFTHAGPASQLPSFGLPSFDGTIASILIRPEDLVLGRPTSAPLSWTAVLATLRADGTLVERRTISAFDGRKTADDVTSGTLVHIVLPHEPGHRYELRFTLAPPAKFSVTYDAIPIVPGETPERPAATREEPHLLGTTGESDPGAMDLAAAWFNDDSLGDGVFEARVALRALNDTDAQRPIMRWAQTFTVSDVRYWIFWNQTLPDQRIACTLARTYVSDPNPTGASTGIGYPSCAMDPQTSTLIARIPERALGNPAAGARFEGLEVRSMSYASPEERGINGAQGDNNAGLVDQLSNQRFAFALGGPAVWDELNGCRFCVEPAAWYTDPLAAGNLPNTLQVTGAAAAFLTFLVGLALLARRRRVLRAWLDRVDGVLSAHDGDAPRGLLALGDVQRQLLATLRKHEITESQFQVVAQRIAFAASQLAMRRDLGLDDGVPGDARATGVSP